MNFEKTVGGYGVIAAVHLESSVTRNETGEIKDT
jgi:hypothetical protein